MDINQCIQYLGLNRNEYRLTQSPPPHEIIEWRGDDPQPTQAELEVAWSAIIAEQDATQHQRLRQPEYPPVEDYLDGIVKGDQTQVQKYIDDCLAVKAKYPKGVA